MRTQSQAGFSLAELLVTVAVVLVMMLAALAMITQATAIDRAVQGSTQVHSSLRAAMNQLAYDLRQTGLGVPRGTRVSGTESWLPFVFYASPTGIGLRSDLDGGFAEVTCTPLTSSANCPTNRLRLDSIRYYQAISCAAPDGATGGVKLVVAVDDDRWSATNCSAFDAADSYLTVGSLSSGTFVGGRSRVSTIEQIYYRFVASSQRPYGRLQRHIAYVNMPSSTYPPTSPSWQTIATNLTDFDFEYQDASGAALAGNPLSSANLALARKIVVFLEGYDLAGPNGMPQLQRLRTEINVRNPQ